MHMVVHLHQLVGVVSAVPVFYPVRAKISIRITFWKKP
jgi:hypothetical protein